jgi:hypothetical protein
MFSAQVQVPQTDGTVKAFTGRGGKITSAEFSCEVDGLLMLTWPRTSGRCSTPTRRHPVVCDGPVARSTSADERQARRDLRLGVAVSGVRKASFKIDRGQDSGMFYAGAAGLKAQPVMNARAAG